jgi:hypothetical protein
MDRKAGPSSSKCRLRASGSSAILSQANGLSWFEVTAGCFSPLQLSSSVCAAETFAIAIPESSANDRPSEAIAIIDLFFLMTLSF